MENDLKDAVFVALAMTEVGAASQGRGVSSQSVRKAGNRPFPRHPQGLRPCQHLDFSALRPTLVF